MCGGYLFPSLHWHDPGRIADRVATHLRNFLSGQYWLYSNSYLDEACRHPGQKPAGKKYIYGPPTPENFARRFVPGLTGELGGQLLEYINTLRFFLAPLEQASKEELLDIEAVLTEKAYTGEAVHVIDSPEPKREIPDGLRKITVKVASGARLRGLT